jgi:hypothetical protein
MPFLGTSITDATETKNSSVGVVEWLENLSNKFWRRRCIHHHCIQIDSN